MPCSSPSRRATTPRAVARAPHRWLLFVHQLPASPSNLRVRTWRRLQQLGALAVKQAVFVLPDTATAREDFEWLKGEVASAGGDAHVFTAGSIDAWSDDALVEEFRAARQAAYGALGGDVEQVLTRVNATTRPRGTRAPAVPRLVAVFRDRLATLERIDFFGSAGRDRVAALVTQLEARTRTAPREITRALASGPIDVTAYTRRMWVTRPRPGVDRMSSAWLIRRFVDPGARFAFAADRTTLPAPDAIPFDMFGVEFSHRGDDCTFETLCAVFGIEQPAVARIAAIVHDLDLKDGRHGAPEVPTVGALIDGLQLSTADDDLLLERGITLFESLYHAFAPAARPPRPLAMTPPPPRAAATATRRQSTAPRRRR